MKIARKVQLRLWSGMAIFVLALCGVAHAQSDAPPPPPPGGGHGHRGPGPDGGLGFLGVEGMLGHKTVTGAPFIASFTQSSMETFADGNQIQHSSSGTIVRDSAGRTRRDLTLPAIGPLAGSGGTPPHIVIITDPVAQMIYILNVDNQTAREMPMPGGPPKNWTGGNPRGPKNQNDVTTTSLGSKALGPLTLQGTETTRMIPAGAIGNAQAIQITQDRWYSPDLQLDAIVSRSDPRMGSTSFQLSNVQYPATPDESLFQVPVGYTVKQGGKFGGKRGGNPPPPPPQN